MTADPAVVGGRYALGESLGRGGMAEVRHAIDRRLGRPVAVKQLRADLATDPTFQARFRREAQAAAGLNHPSIVAVYDTGEEPDPITGVGIPYIVMELVEGQTLRDMMREGSVRLSPERALEITAGVLEALSYSHKAGIVHRDIKPANVMLTPAGEVKVMDFGIARAVADTSSTMTQTAAVIGTAQYLSPEQARGETVDARSDLYSAGCLLYELLVGRPPFVGDSPVSVAYQHVREVPAPPSSLDPRIGPEVDAIVLKALSKDPEDRYASAREMKADITRTLSGQPATSVVPRASAADAQPTQVVPAPPAAPATNVAPAVAAAEAGGGEDRPRRRVGLVLALIALALVAIAGGAWALYRTLQPGDTAAAQVEVPSVVTNTQKEATDQIKADLLVPKVQTTNGEDGTKGTVIEQNPVGGTEVSPQSVVTITVNVGPQSATVPDNLVGKDRKDVERILKQADFENVTAEPATTEPTEAKADEVLQVEPGEGQPAALDQQITLTYATGQSAVPELTGRVEDEAKQVAKEAGFKTKTVRRESDQPEGVVIEQDPPAGETATRGNRITLTVARTPKSTSDPPASKPPKPDPKPSGTVEPEPTASKPPKPEPTASETAEPDPTPSQTAEPDPTPSETPEDDTSTPTPEPTPSSSSAPTPSSTPSGSAPPGG